MSKSSVLVFGANGQVGSALSNKRSSVTAFGRDQVDLATSGAAAQAILDLKPDFVINAAAYTAVDKAESEPQLAELINSKAPEEMAAACQQINSCMIHYSTDYVFDGNGSRPYREDDRTDPLGVYGRTKLDGERGVIKNLDRHLILRTAWVYDSTGKNFVNTMLRLGLDPERKELTVVADQRGTPTFANDLASATLQIVDRISDRGDVEWGVFHVTGSGETTWHGFAEKIFELTETAVKAVPITTADYPTPAPRPAYSVLDNDRLRRVFDIQMPQWQDALCRCLQPSVA